MNRSFLVILLLIIAFNFIGCNPQENRTEILLKEGIKLFQEGKYENAIHKYIECLKTDTSNAEIYNYMGMAYRFRYNETGAQEYRDNEIESFKKAVLLDPKFWIAYKNISASLYYSGKKKEAIPYLQKALELQPNDPEKNLLIQWIEEGNKE